MKSAILVAAFTLCAALGQQPGPPPRRPGLPPDRSPADRYSIEQATSDRAQLSTLAFDALAFLTGDFCSDTFIPPGKVSDYFGFQYMRDIDLAEGGHSGAFLPHAANNVLYILTPEQRSKLIALAGEQEGQLLEFVRQRLPLIKAFRRLLSGDAPPGSAGLSKDAIRKYAAGLYELDGQLAYRRAEVVGEIIAHLDATQKAYLAKMKYGDSRTWPDLPDQVDKRSMSHERHVAVMTYASEFFSWYAGSLDGDVYFCPERHATYFGSFYMKDAPAMGNPNYAISTRLTGDSGEAFLAALDPDRRRLITEIVDLQRGDMESIVVKRRAIATELRRFMTGQAADKAAVLSLSRQYGELDGSISYLYATRFAQVGRSLSENEKKQLTSLRNLDGYVCRGAYLYSDPIPAPAVGSTDFLFSAAGGAQAK
jgi:hypothetical protein